MESFTLIMWAEPIMEDFNKTVDKVYGLLSLLKEYGAELEPRYLTVRRKQEAEEFFMTKQSISEVIKNNINKGGNNIFPDLGCTISFFSSRKEDESCSIRLKVGVSSPNFKNTLVIHFPAVFLGYNERISDLEDLFRNCIHIFQPFWACISNDKNIEMFNNEYWISDKPSTVHWLNYFSKKTAEKLEKSKSLSCVNGLEIFLNGYLFKLQEGLLSVENNEHLKKQKEMNEYFGLL